MRLRAFIGPVVLLCIGGGAYWFTRADNAAASFYAEGLQHDEAFLKSEEDGDFQQAITNLQRAVMLEPKNATYFYSLGTAYAHGEEFKEARDCFIMALKLKPDFKAARENLDIVLAEIAERETKHETYSPPPLDPTSRGVFLRH